MLRHHPKIHVQQWLRAILPPIAGNKKRFLCRRSSVLYPDGAFTKLFGGFPKKADIWDCIGVT